MLIFNNLEKTIYSSKPELAPFCVKLTQEPNGRTNLLLKPVWTNTAKTRSNLYDANNK
jgi:hypothetical protein